MDKDMAEALAAIHASSTLAFGVLTKAVMDHLPDDTKAFFIEAITAQLQSLERDPRQPSSVPPWLRGYRVQAQGVLDLHRQQLAKAPPHR